MMTFTEFHDAARALAKGRYFSTSVKATEFQGELRVEWGLYVDICGHISEDSPELALAKMKQKDGDEVLKTIDVPAPPAPAAPGEEDDGRGALRYAADASASEF